MRRADAKDGMPLSGLRRRRGLLPLFGLVLAGAGLPGVGVRAGDLASPGCMAGGGEAATVGEIDKRQELVLADGRTLVLAGVDLPHEDELDAGAVPVGPALGAWLDGHSVTVKPMTAQPDRWGRWPALVFAVRSGDPPSPPVSVVEALLDAGLARARPDPRILGCWATYLDLENRARAARLGLWDNPYYAVVAADDGVALAGHMGSMAIVEGRVRGVRDTAARLYVRMGAGFAATVQSRVAATWARTGTRPQDWVGKTVRVRGFLDDRFGPQIELDLPEQVQVLDR